VLVLCRQQLQHAGIQRTPALVAGHVQRHLVGAAAPLHDSIQQRRTLLLLRVLLLLVMVVVPCTPASCAASQARHMPLLCQWAATLHDLDQCSRLALGWRGGAAGWMKTMACMWGEV
jgi:hypothetical protein